jgi:hypothetical protein
MSYWNGTHWVADRSEAKPAPRRSRRIVSATLEASLIVLLMFGLIAGTTLAAKGGGGSGGGKGGGHGGHAGGSGSSSLSVVMVEDLNGDGQPNWGDTITFSVSTTATDSPYVEVKCYQDGTLVYGASAGFYAAYPWPGAQMMPLSSPSWTAGAATCSAALNTNLATLSFQVGS